MFAEDLVARQVYAYTRRGDTIFDPLSGRGTTVFESLLNGRPAAGVDINPVAACISGARANAPVLASVDERLHQPGGDAAQSSTARRTCGGFLCGVLPSTDAPAASVLRAQLDWEHSRVDRFISAVVLGCLHGESHKSRNCLSNRMPKTISTKPDYSVRWWKEKGYTAPERDVFAVVRRMAGYRLRHPRAPLRGVVRRRDARGAADPFPSLRGSVSLMVTSPPYLDTTHHAEDQWLRLWFFGGPERPTSRTDGDDRHTNLEAYWQFLTEAWAGCAGLLREDAVIVVRIGGTRIAKEDLLTGLRRSLVTGLVGFDVRTLHAGSTTAIRNRQTNVFRPGTTRQRYEHDFAFGLR